MLALCTSPGRTCEQSGLMLARILPGGVFELLSASAWARALGYPPYELNGKCLHDLMLPGDPGTGEVVGALPAALPTQVTLRCKDERRKCFRLHWRVDSYDKAVFVLADEV